MTSVPQSVSLKDYVLIEKAATILGVHKDTLRRWMATGKITGRRNPANGYRMFRRDQLARWLERFGEEEKGKGC